MKKILANTDNTKLMKKYTGHVGKFIKIKERKQGLGLFYNFCATYVFAFFKWVKNFEK